MLCGEAAQSKAQGKSYALTNCEMKTFSKYLKFARRFVSGLQKAEKSRQR